MMLVLLVFTTIEDIIRIFKNVLKYIGLNLCLTKSLCHFLLVSIICAHRRIMQKIINHESKYKLEVQMRCRVSNQLTNQIHGHQVKSSDMKKILALFHL